LIRHYCHFVLGIRATCHYCFINVCSTCCCFFRFLIINYSVDFNNTVRVCDTALSRDLFPNDYHCLGDNENRPIKWMAIETLEKKFHTTASDVWSLGVLLWELATLAAMPFEVIHRCVICLDHNFRPTTACQEN